MRRIAFFCFAIAVGVVLPVPSASAGPPPPPPPPPPSAEDTTQDTEPQADDTDTLAPTPTDSDEQLVEDTSSPPPAPAADTEPSSQPDAAVSDTVDEDATAASKPDDPPEGDEADGERADRGKPPWYGNRYLQISGYVQPQYTFRLRENARPRDQREFGAGQTRAGIIFAGEPIRRWTYNIHLVIGSQIVNTITRVDTVDEDGDGGVDDIATQSEPVPGIFIERMVVNYRPVEYRRTKDGPTLVWLDLTLGQLRIPFTAANRSPNPALMFPRRSAPNNVFLFGTDLGGLASLGIYDDRVEVSAGVFNGTGLAVGQSNERGALYATRVDVNPLGGFPFAEGDLGRGPFRFGVGGGLLYFPSRLFDDAGNDTRTRARDLRASASLRVAVRGFYLQGEFLRRQRTDSLSNLPLIATGAYAQTSFFFIVYKNLGVAPVGRFGWTRLDESFDPRTTYYADAGMALYLGNEVRPDALRVLLQYLGEWRVTEQESAQGAALQVQLRF